MSTSDSDDSIDWLASDEDDSDTSKTLSPQRAEPSSVAPSSSSSSLSRESPTSHSHCGAEQRRKRRRRRSECRDIGSDFESASVSPLQGFTSVCAQAPVGAELRLNRKRTHSGGEDGLCAKLQADTDERFFHKCSELQCYIAPLSSILQGLMSGRYSDRLSSFQESVAMDRIQRIMGVLQNPHVGRSFFGLLLKIEGMLRRWFPHIQADVTQTDLKQPHSSASPSSTRLKWLHTSPICSVKTPESTLGRPAAAASPACCSQEVTQDHAVSSTSELPSETPRLPPPAPGVSRGPLPFKILSPCLERLLQAKDSIIVPLTAREEGWMS